MPKSDIETLRQTARRQFARCCIPTIVAVAASVLISSLGMPVIFLALIGAGIWAWWRGYRLRLDRPDRQNDSSTGGAE